MSKISKLSIILFTCFLFIVIARFLIPPIFFPIGKGGFIEGFWTLSLPLVIVLFCILGALGAVVITIITLTLKGKGMFSQKKL